MKQIIAAILVIFAIIQADASPAETQGASDIISTEALIQMNAQGSAQEIILREDGAAQIYESLLQQGGAEEAFVGETRIRGKSIGCTKFLSSDPSLVSTICSMTVK
jgi:hypothetical protein